MWQTMTKKKKKSLCKSRPTLSTETGKQQQHESKTEQPTEADLKATTSLV